MAKTALTLSQIKGDFEFDILLYATGRKPNTAGLGLENTDIQVTDRGAIQVNRHLETSVPGVFAVGDVNGGPQFTYMSLDDFRIVFNYLTGDGSYNLRNSSEIMRQHSLLLLHWPKSAWPSKKHVTKDFQLLLKNCQLLLCHVDTSMQTFEGAFKAVVNPETKEILGVTLFGEAAGEIINLITMAMDNKIPYTYIAKQIFTHPTMAENLNDLFAI